MYHIFDFIFILPLVDVLYFGVVGGLDDWEVEIADFVVVLAKDAKKVSDPAN